MDLVPCGIMWCWLHWQWHNCICYLKMIKMWCNMPFRLYSANHTSISITRCQWHQKWHHCISLVKTLEMRCTTTFGHVMPMALESKDAIHTGAMWCLWCQCQMMTATSSKETLHSLGKDNENEVQHDFWPCDPITISTSVCITWC